MKEQKFRKFPELIPGTRIQYMDKDEKTRAGKILSRKGNILTVCIGTKYDPRVSRKYRIPVENVAGYWKGRTAARPVSLIPLKKGS